MKFYLVKLLLETFILVICFSFATVSFSSEVYRYKLKNGLQLFVKEDHRAPVVVSQVWYKIGSSYEPQGLTGISHALEHMMFQGTKKYPPGVLSKIIAQHGGEQNAMTSSDYTVYYQELPAKDLALSFELESDRMSNLSLLKDRFAKEIEVVKEERRLRTDNDPDALTFERFMATANVAGGYHHPVIGWMNDIDHLNVSDLRKWYEQQYAPNNAIIVVVGDVDPKKVYLLTKKYFGSLKAKKLPVIKPQKEIDSPGERNITVSVPAKVPGLIMGYNVPVLKTAKEPWQAYALVVAAAVLDEGESSRIEKEIVRGQQIAAGAWVSYDVYSRLSNIFMLGGAPSQDHTVDELKQALLNQIKILQTSLVSSDELTKIKAQIIAEKVFAKDSMFGQAAEIGDLESVGLSWQDGEEFISRIEKVTPEQVRKVANEFLVPKHLTVAILKPLPLKTGQQHEN